ncbi:MAG: type II toxin-antitoxin system VapC family toxin [Bacillota bacterium]
MRALLDTHTFLWWITDDDRLSGRIREIIGNIENELYLSAASGWEMAIKAGIGKLSLPGDLELFVSEQLSVNAINPLPIQMGHALYVNSLPEYHRDPFDRLIIAQARMEGMPILTSDRQIMRYPVKTIW